MRDLDGVIEFVGHHREDDSKLESARGGAAVPLCQTHCAEGN